MQYSKKLPIFSGIIFILTVAASFFILSNGVGACDTTVCVTAITITGGVFATNIGVYSHKAQIENVYKLKKDLYITANEQQIKYNREMLELEQKFNISKENIEALKYDSQLDEFKDSAISDIQNTIDDEMREASIIEKNNSKY